MCTALFVQFLLAMLVPDYASSTEYWIVNGVYSIALLASGYIYCKCAQVSIVSAVRINRPVKIADTLILLGVIFCLVNGMTPVNDIIMQWLDNIGINIGGVDADMIYGNIYMAVLVLCIIAPVVEELLFRGIIAGGMVNSWRLAPALVVSAIVFALFHMNMAQVVHQMIMGMILALFMYRSGSIWVPIIGHIFNNALVLLLDYHVYSTGWYTDNALWVAIGGIGTAIVGVVLYCIAVPSNSVLQVDQKQSLNSRPVADIAILAVVMTVSIVMLLVVGLA